jgi:hypothetical protein
MSFHRRGENATAGDCVHKDIGPSHFDLIPACTPQPAVQRFCFLRLGELDDHFDVVGFPLQRPQELCGWFAARQ